jgi:hypothetical protein
MALDPNIILEGSRMFQEQARQRRLDQRQSQQDALNMARTAQEIELNRQRLDNEKREGQKLQREAEGQQLFQNLLRQHMRMNPDGRVTTDQSAIRRGLMEAGHLEILDRYNKHLTDTRKAFASMRKEELNAKNQEFGAIGQLIGPVVTAQPEDRPAIFQAQRQRALEMGLDVSDFPEQYSESDLPMLTGAYYSALSAKEQADLVLRDAEHDARLPGLQADALEKQLDLIRKNMTGARSGADWQARRHFLTRKLPADIVDEFVPEEHSPEAAAQMEQLTSEAGAARTIQHSGRVWQFNTRSGEFDIDLGPSEGALGRQERARRPGGAHGAAGLSPSQAQAALRMCRVKRATSRPAAMKSFTRSPWLRSRRRSPTAAASTWMS